MAVVVKFDGCACGEIGGDAALAIYSLCDPAVWNGPGFDAATAFECWAADIFASSDWNDVLDEYNALTPGGKIGDGWVLYENKNEIGKEKEKQKTNQYLSDFDHYSKMVDEGKRMNQSMKRIWVPMVNWSFQGNGNLN